MANWKKWYIENLEGNEVIVPGGKWECMSVDNWKGSPLKEKQTLFRQPNNGPVCEDVSLKFVRAYIEGGSFKIKKK